MAETRILRIRHVVAKVGLSKSKIYLLIKAGEFPKPVRLAATAVGWKSTDLDKWIESRPEVTA